MKKMIGKTYLNHKNDWIEVLFAPNYTEPESLSGEGFCQAVSGDLTGNSVWGDGGGDVYEARYEKKRSVFQSSIH